jgi:hypothetical protein
MLRSTAASNGQQARMRGEQGVPKQTDHPHAGPDVLPTGLISRGIRNLRLFEA